MMRFVFRRREQDKVLKPIVAAIAVAMVNMFLRTKRSFKVLLHDVAMFEYIPVGSFYFGVSAAVGMSMFVPVAVFTTVAMALFIADALIATTINRKSFNVGMAKCLTATAGAMNNPDHHVYNDKRFHNTVN